MSSATPQERFMPLSKCRILVAENEHHVVPEVAAVVEWSKKFPQPDQKTEEWKNQRAYFCTASQHASALGRCKYKPRQECLRQYAGVIENKFSGNVATRHGERYEDEAVAKYKELRRVNVLHFGMLPFYEQETWLGGSPDGISVDGYLIEVKCPYKRRPNGTVPAHYMPQIQSMMHGLNLKACHFVEYVPATKWQDETFDIIEVPRDAQYWVEALPLLETFWDEVNVLRNAVTTDMSLDTEQHVAKKPRRSPPPAAPCNIVLVKPVQQPPQNALYTADTLPMPFMAQLCTQGLGGTTNIEAPTNPKKQGP